MDRHRKKERRPVRPLREQSLSRVAGGFSYTIGHVPARYEFRSPLQPEIPTITVIDPDKAR